MTEISQPRILIVDDEKAIRRFLNAALETHGYKIFEASSGAEALEKSVSAHPDAIILDLGLPDQDGVEVINQIRARSRVPILIISVREEIKDKLDAFEAGADDYLIKPFDPAEILARLRAVMRRLIPADRDTVYKVKGLCVDVSQHAASIGGRPVALSPKEFDLLKVLVMKGGAVMTHRHILEEVWGRLDRAPNDAHIVRVTIKNLREKIEANPAKPAIILSIPGVGYRIAES